MITTTPKPREGGFTLFEVLITLAIIAFLAILVIFGINPQKQLRNNRNAGRQIDVTAILNAAYQYSLDNKGAIPAGITDTATEVCATGAPSCKGLVDLSSVTINEKYLTTIPKDPLCSTVCSPNGTGYKILRTTDGHFVVNAPAAERGLTISVSR